MKFIEKSLTEIATAKSQDVDVVIRVETNSGSPKPRLLKILEVGEDYIVARGREQSSEEVFNFNHVASWRFAKHEPIEWTWKF